MTGTFYTLRKALQPNNTVVVSTVNLGKAMVSAYDYLHKDLLAGNFSQVVKTTDQHAGLGKSLVDLLGCPVAKTTD